MRIAFTTRQTSAIAVACVVAVVVALGIWTFDRSEQQQAPSSAALDVHEPQLELDLQLDFQIEPSSSSVQRESSPPPEQPFYASLFVAGATWDLPCTFGVGIHDELPASMQRCHVDSVEVTADETRARIACWFVKDPDVRDPAPAINTYVMTANGLYINDVRGEPVFTPSPTSKPLPKDWGLHEPSNLEGDNAHAMVRHHGAWCRIDEFQGWDASGGTAECISRRGLVGSSYSHDMMTQRCGDVP
ncbi:MAG TPA: hypothetical protein VMZ53_01930 [Kofleriaceae bacterium]|nr:hypothetical protein [Kofleriaceae bacterium]